MSKSDLMLQGGADGRGHVHALTHKAGRIEQQNFTDSPLLQLADMPKVDVHIVPGTGRPTGASEMAVPVVIPAVLNAIYAASRIRFRSLPLVWP